MSADNLNINAQRALDTRESPYNRENRGTNAGRGPMLTVTLLAICILLPSIAHAQKWALDTKKILRGVSVEREADRYIEKMARNAASPTQASKRITIDGELRREPDGSVFLSPTDDPSVSIPFDQATTVSPAAIGLPVAVTITNPQASNANVNAVTLSAAREWKAQSAALPKQSADVLNHAFEKIDRAQAALFAASGDSKSRETLAETVNAAKEQVVDAYATAHRSGAIAQEEIGALVKAYLALERTGKALYGKRDIYRPGAYERIFENSRGVGAVAPKNNAPAICTAFLVAKDAALTAAHCLQQYLATELEVRFNYEQKLDDTFLPAKSYQIDSVIARGRAPEAGERPIDYALLKLKANSGQSAGDDWPIQCLGADRVHRGDPIYVVGHPYGDPRSVADNAVVLFPFRAVGKEYDALKFIVEAEASQDPQGSSLLQSFLESYRPKPLASGETFYEQYSKRWQQPTFAADCDTYAGNSGSPAYSRQNHRVVGILIDGEPDQPEAYRPGWRRHEAILPITLVLEQLQDLDEWKALEGRCAL